MAGVIAGNRISASSPDTDLPTVAGLRVSGDGIRLFAFGALFNPPEQVYLWQSIYLEGCVQVPHLMLYRAEIGCQSYNEQQGSGEQE